MESQFLWPIQQQEGSVLRMPKGDRRIMKMTPIDFGRTDAPSRKIERRVRNVPKGGRA